MRQVGVRSGTTIHTSAPSLSSSSCRQRHHHPPPQLLTPTLSPPPHPLILQEDLQYLKSRKGCGYLIEPVHGNIPPWGVQVHIATPTHSYSHPQSLI